MDTRHDIKLSGANVIRNGLADRSKPLLASFSQQRLWFLAQIEGASEAYHIPLRFRLNGALDAGALRKALDHLVARHETLRTAFYTINGELFQRIGPPSAGLRLEHADLRETLDAEAQLSERMKIEASTPFDLKEGPLIRGVLLRVAEEEHVLLITMHHIVSDGWSMGVLTYELGYLYMAYGRGEVASLEPLPIQYADYAAWQRQWLSGDVLAEQSAYWQRVLSGAPAVIELPTDRSRSTQQDFAGGYVPVGLTAELTTRLRSLSRRHGVTLFMTVLAAWSLVLSRLSSQEDVVIGVPTANRNRLEVEGLIGFFVNTIALRIDLSSTSDVGELLKKVKELVLEGEAHQELPFEKVVGLVKPMRSLSHTPIFQVMFTWFTWQNDMEWRVDLADLKSSWIDRPWLQAKCDLTLRFHETGDRVSGGVEYATALFDRETIERHTGYLLNVLTEMAADDRQSVRAIRFLTPFESNQLLVEWSGVVAHYPQDRCIHELFEEQAAGDPAAVAVVCEGRELSYGELNARANRLARHLSRLGVGPDVIVGLCVERSIEMVVGLLGILKAGGAYLPLDPDYPPERLAFMLKDAAAPVLVAQSTVRSILPRRYPGIIVMMDKDWARIAELADGPLERTVSPRNLAYVIYTSGSTGQPKGVMNEHRGMVNRIFAQEQIESYRDDEVCCHSTSISFVDAVFAALGPLCNGLRLVIIPGEALKDSEALAAIVAREHVTQLVTVPSLARAMAESASIMQGLSGLRTWTLSGEEVPADLLIRLQQLLPSCQFLTWYGSSEVSSDAAFYRSAHFEGARVPLGRPVPNVQLYVLDKRRQPVPIGITGEIYVGGVGVGRGYINLPALTQESFLPDHLGKSAEGRLYRTGDLGRWNSNGMLEYLGRSDLQVKIRGFRIELGEIESHLRQHPGVREAAVLAREDVPGAKRLVAYYTRAEGEGATAEALRAHLAHSLPGYMVPAAYVPMAAMPLTPNGKLDRRALPAPQGDAFGRWEYEAPIGEIEVALAKIWSEVLGIDRISRSDNFFDLGGHSLLVVRLLSGVSDAFRIEPPMATLFVHPTLRTMAAALG